MARKADIPCAGNCGRLLWSGSTSLPAGQAKCRDCRKQDRVGRPKYSTTTERRCAWCGGPHNNPSDILTCSRTCGQSLRQQQRSTSTRKPLDRSAAHNKSDIRRATRFGVEYEPIDRSVVYNRDGWVCGICKGVVDPELRYPNEGSASLDHVVPLSLGGPHLYTNVQCAHLGCNWGKRADVVPAVGVAGG